MKNLCIVGVILVVCVAYSQTASIGGDSKRDIRDIFKQLKNADGFEPAPRPEELTEDFGGAKERQARSFSFENFRPFGGGYGGYDNGYGGYGGYGGYDGPYNGGYGGYGGNGGFGGFGGILGGLFG